MEYTCKICNCSIEGNSHFWENHGIKMSKYFEEYDPRETKDGEKVIFKNSIEKYYETDFNDLNKRRKWAKENPELAKEYFIDLLVKRKVKKNLIYAPGQILLRLSNLPSILYYEKEFNQSYSEICKKLGFKIKYKNKLPKIDWNDSIEIITDSREQKSLQFPKHIVTSIDTVKFGDYILKNNPQISVERKSLSDLAGTLSAGFDRFKREIKRAKDNKGYIIILVESPFKDFKSIEYLPQTKHIKSTYEHLAKRARELYEEFDNFQLCFAEGRKEAARIVEFVLKTGKQIKTIDLQLLIETKKI